MVIYLVCMAWPAWSDTALRYRLQPAPEGRPGGLLEVFIKDDRVALVGDSIDGTTYRVWFDATRRHILVLDPRAGGYYRLDAQSAARVQSALATFRRRVDQRIAGHDPTQIDEAMILVKRIESREFGGGQAPAIEFRPADGIDSVVSECTPVGVFQSTDGEWHKLRRLCVVDPPTTIDDARDVRTIEAFGDLSRWMASTVSMYARHLPRIGIDLSAGLPLRIDYLDHGSPRALMLESVQSVPVDDGVFDVPGEYDRLLPLRTGGPG